MSQCGKQCVVVANDDKDVCSLIARVLEEELDIDVPVFTAGRECLEHIQAKGCDLLITGSFTVGMEGVDLLRRAKGIRPFLTVIVLGENHDADIAVKTLKAGAFDFVTMPFDRHVFLGTVERALSVSQECPVRDLEPLTATEQEVLQLLLDGKSSKEIAGIRNRSVRTIEDQRCSIMHKLRVDNIVSLVRRIESTHYYMPRHD